MLGSKSWEKWDTIKYGLISLLIGLNTLVGTSTLRHVSRSSRKSTPKHYGSSISITKPQLFRLFGEEFNVNQPISLGLFPLTPFRAPRPQSTPINFSIPHDESFAQILLNQFLDAGDYKIRLKPLSHVEEIEARPLKCPIQISHINFDKSLPSISTPGKYTFTFSIERDVAKELAEKIIFKLLLNQELGQVDFNDTLDPFLPYSIHNKNDTQAVLEIPERLFANYPDGIFYIAAFGFHKKSENYDTYRRTIKKILTEPPHLNSNPLWLSGMILLGTSKLIRASENVVLSIESDEGEFCPLEELDFKTPMVLAPLLTNKDSDESSQAPPLNKQQNAAPLPSRIDSLQLNLCDGIEDDKNEDKDQVDYYSNYSSQQPKPRNNLTAQYQNHLLINSQSEEDIEIGPPTINIAELDETLFEKGDKVGIKLFPVPPGIEKGGLTFQNIHDRFTVNSRLEPISRDGTITCNVDEFFGSSKCGIRVDCYTNDKHKIYEINEQEPVMKKALGKILIPQEHSAVSCNTIVVDFKIPISSTGLFTFEAYRVSLLLQDVILECSSDCCPTPFLLCKTPYIHASKAKDLDENGSVKRLVFKLKNSDPCLTSWNNVTILVEAQQVNYSLLDHIPKTVENVYIGLSRPFSLYSPEQDDLRISKCPTMITLAPGIQLASRQYKANSLIPWSLYQYPTLTNQQQSLRDSLELELVNDDGQDSTSSQLKVSTNSRLSGESLFPPLPNTNTRGTKANDTIAPIIGRPKILVAPRNAHKTIGKLYDFSKDILPLNLLDENPFVNKTDLSDKANGEERIEFVDTRESTFSNIHINSRKNSTKK